MTARLLIAACTLALVFSFACGKYGSPVRSSEIEESEPAASQTPTNEDAR